jgi:caa(3)-type oxidase subunit IV
MDAPEQEIAADVAVWGWLVGLLAAGLLVIFLPLQKFWIIALIFMLAAVKAFLVARNYMHLKHEHVLIYVIAAVPVIFVLGLLIALVPDMIFGR